MTEEEQEYLRWYYRTEDRKYYSGCVIVIIVWYWGLSYILIRWRLAWQAIPSILPHPGQSINAHVSVESRAPSLETPKREYNPSSTEVNLDILASLGGTTLPPRCIRR